MHAVSETAIIIIRDCAAYSRFLLHLKMSDDLVRASREYKQDYLSEQTNKSRHRRTSSMLHGILQTVLHYPSGEDWVFP